MKSTLRVLQVANLKRDLEDLIYSIEIVGHFPVISSQLHSSSSNPVMIGNIFRYTMITRLSRVIVALINLIVIRSQIYLHRTDDEPGIEHYDCVIVQSSLSYCRRPIAIPKLSRGDNDTQPCVRNGGEMHPFSELRAKNITTNTVQHQWTTTFERVEEYSLYLRDLRVADGHLCRCLNLGAFGPNCEYQLTTGQTFEETLQWQSIVRKKNPVKVQIYAHVVCYETLKCDSGLLCLDWREICDAIQQCLEGRDEENCDLLEMNQCDPEEEYRCSNGMCIPDEFFVDGERDCLDWSDELLFEAKGDHNCPRESVSSECDDHLCTQPLWSCGDEQCIPDRMDFQRVTYLVSCINGRDQYFSCETDRTHFQWTMPNGRCYMLNNDKFLSSPVLNRTDQDRCEYLLKCALSGGGERDCRCNGSLACQDRFKRLCPLSLVQYPRGAVMSPFTFFYYNRTRDWQYKWPDLFRINGTVRCRGSLVSVTQLFRYSSGMNFRFLLEDQFCRSSKNVSIAEQECHHDNESTDRCGEWNSMFVRHENSRWNGELFLWRRWSWPKWDGHWQELCSCSSSSISLFAWTTDVFLDPSLGRWLG